MEKKAIKVEYRKVSESFPEWLKYEITVLKENGEIEKIPAYGKDLQDALSRVVHDEKVEVINKKTKKIPFLFWIVLWVSYILGLVNLAYIFSKDGIFNGLIFILGIFLFLFSVLVIRNWLKKRNVDQNG